MPFGAEFVGASTVRFRLWAPSARKVTLNVDNVGLRADLDDTGGGWRESTVTGIAPGMLYSYRIDDELDVPDPASRFNPRGPSGPSEIVDPQGFAWHDDDWRGHPWHEAVLYELHVGTFTPEGTFAAVVPRLGELAELGVNVIELMPIGTFAGKRGWGYDGVLPFAPHPAYGRPEDLKRLVQAAHEHGIGVILDVVYNHFGPEGNYLPRYASGFFTDRRHTPWGDAIEFEGEAGRNVRRFFIENALYWLQEYRLDGLRLDAVHEIHDASPNHFIDELAAAIAAGPARHRHVYLVLENGDNQAKRLQSEGQGLLSKAQWNDDFHHPLHVLLTGETEGYYQDYAQAPLQQLGRVLAEGFAFQGEPFTFANDKPRGEPSAHLPPTAFINVLQTHDQIGNRAFGERIAQLTHPEKLRAAMTLLLLAPQPPMLFMGEEYAARQPFLYFCDYCGELAAAVVAGRRNEFAGFAAFADARTRERIPDPNAQDTFRLSQLHWEERRDSPHREWLEYTRTLLHIRARAVAPSIPRIVPGAASYRVDGTVLKVHWRLQGDGGLSMLANLGPSTRPQPEVEGADLLHSSATSVGADLAAWEVRMLRT